MQIVGVAALKLICTPVHLPQLVYGFLYNEELISCLSEVISLDINQNGTYARIQLRHLASGQIPIYATGYGDQIPLENCQLLPLPIQVQYTLTDIHFCAETMNRNARRYLETGGTHCSALFRGTKMLCLFEDIGRHNTLDKLAGHCLLEGIDTSDTLLITTGRISADMVRKAAKSGASVIVSFSTPTQQAVDIAKSANITLIRYIGKGGEICTAPERILPSI